jgi:hypothetical protein
MAWRDYKRDRRNARHRRNIGEQLLRRLKALEARLRQYEAKDEQENLVVKGFGRESMSRRMNTRTLKCKLKALEARLR